MAEGQFIGSSGSLITAALETAGYVYQSALLDALAGPFQNSVGALIYTVGVIVAVMSIVLTGKFKWTPWLLLGPAAFYAVISPRTEAFGSQWKFGVESRNSELAKALAGEFGDRAKANVATPRVSTLFARFNDTVSSVTSNIVSIMVGSNPAADKGFVTHMAAMSRLQNSAIANRSFREYLQGALFRDCGPAVSAARRLIDGLPKDGAGMWRNDPRVEYKGKVTLAHYRWMRYEWWAGGSITSHFVLWNNQTPDAPVKWTEKEYAAQKFALEKLSNKDITYEKDDEFFEDYENSSYWIRKSHAAGTVFTSWGQSQAAKNGKKIYVIREHHSEDVAIAKKFEMELDSLKDLRIAIAGLDQLEKKSISEMALLKDADSEKYKLLLKAYLDAFNTTIDVSPLSMPFLQDIYVDYPDVYRKLRELGSTPTTGPPAVDNELIKFFEEKISAVEKTKGVQSGTIGASAMTDGDPESEVNKNRRLALVNAVPLIQKDAPWTCRHVWAFTQFGTYAESRQALITNLRKIEDDLRKAEPQTNAPGAPNAPADIDQKVKSEIDGFLHKFQTTIGFAPGFVDTPKIGANNANANGVVSQWTDALRSSNRLMELMQFLSLYMLRNELGKGSTSSFLSSFVERGKEFTTLVSNSDDKTDFAVTEDSRNKNREWSERNKIITTAMNLPYYQGLGLFLLSILFPLFAFLLLVPGKHSGFLMWFMLWIWLKSWDIGFAIAMVLDDFLFVMFSDPSKLKGPAPEAAKMIQGDLAAAYQTWNSLDPTYQLSTYFSLVAIALGAIPTVSAYLIMGSMQGGAGLISQGLSYMSEVFERSSQTADSQGMLTSLRWQYNQQKLERSQAAIQNYLHGGHSSGGRSSTGNMAGLQDLRGGNPEGKDASALMQQGRSSGYASGYASAMANPDTKHSRENTAIMDGWFKIGQFGRGGGLFKVAGEIRNRADGVVSSAYNLDNVSLSYQFNSAKSAIELEINRASAWASYDQGYSSESQHLHALASAYGMLPIPWAEESGYESEVRAAFGYNRIEADRISMKSKEWAERIGLGYALLKTGVHFYNMSNIKAAQAAKALGATAAEVRTIEGVTSAHRRTLDEIDRGIKDLKDEKTDDKKKLRQNERKIRDFERQRTTADKAAKYLQQRVLEQNNPQLNRAFSAFLNFGLARIAGTAFTTVAAAEKDRVGLEKRIAAAKKQLEDKRAAGADSGTPLTRGDIEGSIADLRALLLAKQQVERFISERDNSFIGRQRAQQEQELAVRFGIPVAELRTLTPQRLQQEFAKAEKTIRAEHQQLANGFTEVLGSTKAELDAKKEGVEQLQRLAIAQLNTAYAAAISGRTDFGEVGTSLKSNEYVNPWSRAANDLANGVASILLGDTWAAAKQGKVHYIEQPQNAYVAAQNDHLALLEKLAFEKTAEKQQALQEQIALSALRLQEARGAALSAARGAENWTHGRGIQSARAWVSDTLEVGDPNSLARFTNANGEDGVSHWIDTVDKQYADKARLARRAAAAADGIATLADAHAAHGARIQELENGTPTYAVLITIVSSGSYSPETVAAAQHILAQIEQARKGEAMSLVDQQILRQTLIDARELEVQAAADAATLLQLNQTLAALSPTIARNPVATLRELEAQADDPTAKAELARIAASVSGKSGVPDSADISALEVAQRAAATAAIASGIERVLIGQELLRIQNSSLDRRIAADIDRVSQAMARDGEGVSLSTIRALEDIRDRASESAARDAMTATIQRLHDLPPPDMNLVVSTLTAVSANPRLSAGTRETVQQVLRQAQDQTVTHQTVIVIISRAANRNGLPDVVRRELQTIQNTLEQYQHKAKTENDLQFQSIAVSSDVTIASLTQGLELLDRQYLVEMHRLDHLASDSLLPNAKDPTLDSVAFSGMFETHVENLRRLGLEHEVLLERFHEQANEQDLTRGQKEHILRGVEVATDNLAAQYLREQVEKVYRPGLSSPDASSATAEFRKREDLLRLNFHQQQALLAGEHVSALLSGDSETIAKAGRNLTELSERFDFQNKLNRQAYLALSFGHETDCQALLVRFMKDQKRFTHLELTTHLLGAEEGRREMRELEIALHHTSARAQELFKVYLSDADSLKTRREFAEVRGRMEGHDVAVQAAIDLLDRGRPTPAMPMDRTNLPFLTDSNDTTTFRESRDYVIQRAAWAEIEADRQQVTRRLDDRQLTADAESRLQGRGIRPISPEGRVLIASEKEAILIEERKEATRSIQKAVTTLTVGPTRVYAKVLEAYSESVQAHERSAQALMGQTTVSDNDRRLLQYRQTVTKALADALQMRANSEVKGKLEWLVDREQTFAAARALVFDELRRDSHTTIAAELLRNNPSGLIDLNELIGHHADDLVDRFQDTELRNDFKSGLAELARAYSTVRERMETQWRERILQRHAMARREVEVRLTAEGRWEQKTSSALFEAEFAKVWQGYESEHLSSLVSLKRQFQAVSTADRANFDTVKNSLELTQEARWDRVHQIASQMYSPEGEARALAEVQGLLVLEKALLQQLEDNVHTRLQVYTRTENLRRAGSKAAQAEAVEHSDAAVSKGAYERLERQNAIESARLAIGTVLDNYLTITRTALPRGVNVHSDVYIAANRARSAIVEEYANSGETTVVAPELFLAYAATLQETPELARAVAQLERIDEAQVRLALASASNPDQLATQLSELYLRKDTFAGVDAFEKLVKSEVRQWSAAVTVSANADKIALAYLLSSVSSSLEQGLSAKDAFAIEQIRLGVVSDLGTQATERFESHGLPGMLRVGTANGDVMLRMKADFARRRALNDVSATAERFTALLPALAAYALAPPPIDQLSSLANDYQRKLVSANSDLDRKELDKLRIDGAKEFFDGYVALVMDRVRSEAIPPRGVVGMLSDELEGRTVLYLRRELETLSGSHAILSPESQAEHKATARSLADSIGRVLSKTSRHSSGSSIQVLDNASLKLVNLIDESLEPNSMPKALETAYGRDATVAFLRAEHTIVKAKFEATLARNDRERGSTDETGLERTTGLVLERLNDRLLVVEQACARKRAEVALELSSAPVRDVSELYQRVTSKVREWKDATPENYAELVQDAAAQLFYDARTIQAVLARRGALQLLALEESKQVFDTAARTHDDTLLQEQLWVRDVVSKASDKAAIRKLQTLLKDETLSDVDATLRSYLAQQHRSAEVVLEALRSGKLSLDLAVSADVSADLSRVSGTTFALDSDTAYNDISLLTRYLGHSDRMAQVFVKELERRADPENTPDRAERTQAAALQEELGSALLRSSEERERDVADATLRFSGTSVRLFTADEIVRHADRSIDALRQQAAYDKLGRLRVGDSEDAPEAAKSVASKCVQALEQQRDRMLLLDNRDVVQAALTLDKLYKECQTLAIDAKLVAAHAVRLLEATRTVSVFESVLRKAADRGEWANAAQLEDFYLAANAGERALLLPQTRAIIAELSGTQQAALVENSENKAFVDYIKKLDKSLAWTREIETARDLIFRTDPPVDDITQIITHLRDGLVLSPDQAPELTEAASRLISDMVASTRSPAGVLDWVDAEYRRVPELLSEATWTDLMRQVISRCEKRPAVNPAALPASLYESSLRAALQRSEDTFDASNTEMERLRVTGELQLLLFEVREAFARHPNDAGQYSALIRQYEPLVATQVVELQRATAVDTLFGAESGYITHSPLDANDIMAEYSRRVEALHRTFATDLPLHPKPDSLYATLNAALVALDQTTSQLLADSERELDDRIASEGVVRRYVDEAADLSRSNVLGTDTVRKLLASLVEANTSEAGARLLLDSNALLTRAATCASTLDASATGLDSENQFMRVARYAAFEGPGPERERVLLLEQLNAALTAHVLSETVVEHTRTMLEQAGKYPHGVAPTSVVEVVTEWERAQKWAEQQSETGRLDSDQRKTVDGALQTLLNAELMQLGINHLEMQKFFESAALEYAFSQGSGSTQQALQGAVQKFVKEMTTREKSGVPVDATTARVELENERTAFRALVEIRLNTNVAAEEFLERDARLRERAANVEVAATRYIRSLSISSMDEPTRNSLTLFCREALREVQQTVSLLQAVDGAIGIAVRSEHQSIRDTARSVILPVLSGDGGPATASDIRLAADLVALCELLQDVGLRRAGVSEEVALAATTQLSTSVQKLVETRATLRFVGESANDIADAAMHVAQNTNLSQKQQSRALWDSTVDTLVKSYESTTQMLVVGEALEKEDVVHVTLQALRHETESIRRQIDGEVGATALGVRMSTLSASILGREGAGLAMAPLTGSSVVGEEQRAQHARTVAAWIQTQTSASEVAKAVIEYATNLWGSAEVRFEATGVTLPYTEQLRVIRQLLEPIIEHNLQELQQRNVVGASERIAAASSIGAEAKGGAAVPGAFHSNVPLEVAQLLPRFANALLQAPELFGSLQRASLLMDTKLQYSELGQAADAEGFRIPAGTRNAEQLIAVWKTEIVGVQVEQARAEIHQQLVGVLARQNSLPLCIEVVRQVKEAALVSGGELGKPIDELADTVARALRSGELRNSLAVLGPNAALPGVVAELARVSGVKAAHDLTVSALDYVQSASGVARDVATGAALDLHIEVLSSQIDKRLPVLAAAEPIEPPTIASAPSVLDEPAALAARDVNQLGRKAFGGEAWRAISGKQQADRLNAAVGRILLAATTSTPQDVKAIKAMANCLPDLATGRDPAEQLGNDIVAVRVLANSLAETAAGRALVKVEEAHKSLLEAACMRDAANASDALDKARAALSNAENYTGIDPNALDVLRTIAEARVSVAAKRAPELGLRSADQEALVAQLNERHGRLVPPVVTSRPVAAVSPITSAEITAFAQDASRLQSEIRDYETGPGASKDQLKALQLQVLRLTAVASEIGEPITAVHPDLGELSSKKLFARVIARSADQTAARVQRIDTSDSVLSTIALVRALSAESDKTTREMLAGQAIRAVLANAPTTLTFDRIAIEAIRRRTTAIQGLASTGTDPKQERAIIGATNSILSTLRREGKEALGISRMSEAELVAAIQLERQYRDGIILNASSAPLGNDDYSLGMLSSLRTQMLCLTARKVIKDGSGSPALMEVVALTVRDIHAQAQLDLLRLHGNDRGIAQAEVLNGHRGPRADIFARGVKADVLCKMEFQEQAKALLRFTECAIELHQRDPKRAEKILQFTTELASLLHESIQSLPSPDEFLVHVRLLNEAITQCTDAVEREASAPQFVHMRDRKIPLWEQQISMLKELVKVTVAIDRTGGTETLKLVDNVATTAEKIQFLKTQVAATNVS